MRNRTVIFSIIRLASLVRFANTTNPTWDYYEPAYMSTLELDLAIITACLPAVRAFFVQIGVTGLATAVKSNISRGTSTGQTVGGATKSTTTITAKPFTDRKPRHGDEDDFIPLKEFDNNSRQTDP